MEWMTLLLPIIIVLLQIGSLTSKRFVFVPCILSFILMVCFEMTGEETIESGGFRLVYRLSFIGCLACVIISKVIDAILKNGRIRKNDR